MTTKEKLDLLWKYLLLIVLVYGFSQLGRPSHPMMFDHKFMGSPDHGMMWMGDDMDIEVDVQSDGTDSTITVTINGETIDIQDMDISKFPGDGDAHVFIKKMTRDHKPNERHIKVIKKELRKDK